MSLQMVRTRAQQTSVSSSLIPTITILSWWSTTHIHQRKPLLNLSTLLIFSFSLISLELDCRVNWGFKKKYPAWNRLEWPKQTGMVWNSSRGTGMKFSGHSSQNKMKFINLLKPKSSGTWYRLYLLYVACKKTKIIFYGL